MIDLEDYCDSLRKQRKREMKYLDQENRILKILADAATKRSAPEPKPLPMATAEKLTAREMVQHVLPDLPNPFWYNDLMPLLDAVFDHIPGASNRAYTGVRDLLRFKVIRRTTGGYEIVPTPAQAALGSSTPVR